MDMDPMNLLETFMPGNGANNGTNGTEVNGTTMDITDPASMFANMLNGTNGTNGTNGAKNDLPITSIIEPIIEPPKGAATWPGGPRMPIKKIQSRKAPPFDPITVAEGTELIGLDGQRYKIALRKVSERHYWVKCSKKNIKCGDLPPEEPKGAATLGGAPRMPIKKIQKRKAPPFDPITVAEGTEMIGLDGQRYKIALRKVSERHYWVKVSKPKKPAKPKKPKKPIKPIKPKKKRGAPSISAAKMEIGSELYGLDGEKYKVTLRKNGVQYWAKCSFRTIICTGMRPVPKRKKNNPGHNPGYKNNPGHNPGYKNNPGHNPGYKNNPGHNPAPVPPPIQIASLAMPKEPYPSPAPPPLQTAGLAMPRETYSTVTYPPRPKITKTRRKEEERMMREMFGTKKSSYRKKRYRS